MYLQSFSLSVGGHGDRGGSITAKIDGLVSGKAGRLWTEFTISDNFKGGHMTNLLVAASFQRGFSSHL